MQTEDKRNQIESWFSTPEPLLDRIEPLKISMEDSKFVVKWCGIGFLVCVTIIVMWETGIWPFGKRVDIFEDIESFVKHLVAVVTFVGGFLLFLTTINSIFEYSQAKAKYAELKPAYDAAKARYDALPSTDQMVEWLKEDLANQEKSFHDKMIEGYDERDEIQLPETLFVWIPEMSNGKTERTEDGYHLCSEWKVNALNISNWTVIIGRWIYDWRENRVLNKFENEFGKHEYPYLDIASIGTGSNGVHEVIQINMKDGEQVEFSVEGPLFIDDQGSQGLPSLATSIRSQLRDAKKIDRTENTEDNSFR